MKTIALTGKCFAVIMILLTMLIGMALAATLTLPAALKTVESEAFMGDASLDQVIIPEGVESISDRAFSGTGISTLYLPEGDRDRCFQRL